MATEILLSNVDGVRLDAFISSELDISRSLAAELIDGGKVTVNGKPAKKSNKVMTGNEVSVEVPELSEPEALPQDIPLDIVYEDDDLLVVNKPKGMVVHPAPGNPLLPLERNACLPGCVWNATPRSLSPLERNIGFWTQA